MMEPPLSLYTDVETELYKLKLAERRMKSAHYSCTAQLVGVAI